MPINLQPSPDAVISELLTRLAATERDRAILAVQLEAAIGQAGELERERDQLRTELEEARTRATVNAQTRPSERTTP